MKILLTFLLQSYFCLSYVTFMDILSTNSTVLIFVFIYYLLLFAFDL